MGEEINKSHFTPEDFAQFEKNLKVETDLLRQWFEDRVFASEGESAGFELEAWLVDQNFLPAPQNESLIKALNSPLVVPELSRFNFEINSSPHRLDENLFKVLQEELEIIWGRCDACAHQLHTDLMMIGTLPTLREDMLNLQTMSPLERYRALNEQVLRLRRGRALKLDIDGKEHLHTQHSDVMLESAGTSLQIHLQLEPSQAARFFNAALILAAPMVAVAANSPYLFGKDLWDETRIPLFEQSVDLWSLPNQQQQTIGRVTFGSGYIHDSMFECFLENLQSYPVMLPILFQSYPEEMKHLSLHNGTIWRWNRPLIGMNSEGRPHLRIEHRVTAAGPSIADVIANIALFFGLVHELGTQEAPPENHLSFEKASANFYAAAKDGLRAQVFWMNGRKVPLQSLLLEVFLPMATRGLEKLGIKKSDIEFYLKYIMENRVRGGHNGSTWQRGFVAKYGRDFSALMAAYAEHQHRGQPVHEWRL